MFRIPFVQGKRRPHPGYQDGKIVMFSDEIEKQNELAVRLAYSRWSKQANMGKVVKFYRRPLNIKATAYFPVPKRFNREQMEMAIRGEIKPTQKADGDNILKLITDSLNGYAFTDDCQIIHWEIDKCYGVKEWTDVVIEDAGGQPCP